MIRIKTPEEIERMKKPGFIVASVFEAVLPLMKAGATTYDIDRVAYETITKQHAIPSFLNFPGEFKPFPASTCISIDDEVVHGIPSKDRYLEDGMIVSVDVGAIYDDMHGDAARTYLIGDVKPEIRKLVAETEKSFWLGLEQAVVGNRLGDISHAVQAHAEQFGYGVVRDLTGHGIGYEMHEDPAVLNYGRPGRGIRLVNGMTLAVEPMITLSGNYEIEVAADGWTIYTADGSPAAHYENSFAITDDGVIVFTK